MEQMTLDECREYEQLKTELGRKLDETSENFIVIGYILKQVRDKGLFRHENYRDIYGFGMGAYGLSRSTVSRFININTKFSVGSNSREIRSEYKGYGRSKLQEMLSIDDSDMGLITAASTVEDIRELGNAEKAQRQLQKEESDKALPLVKMSADLEENNAGSRQEPMEPLDAVLTAFWKGNRELYSKVAAGLLPPGIVAEEISPSGSSTFRDGVNIIFFYDLDKGLKLRSYAKGKADITQYTYQELVDRTMNLDLMENNGKTEGTPENKEVTDTLPEEPVATPQPEPEAVPEGQPAPYVPIPGQTSVSDLQGIVPDKNTSAGGDADTGITVVPIPAMDETREATGDNMEDVIDGEYRELEGESGEQTAFDDIPYTDEEIRRVLRYLDKEYLLEVGLIGTHRGDSLKRLSCKVARDCIRRCYSTIAEQLDSVTKGEDE